MFAQKFTIALAGLALLGSTPLLASGVKHGFFMRGSIVGESADGPVICIGMQDGATVGQVLEVYRVKINPGPQKGAATTYRRERVGQVKIDHVFDDHFAHVSVVDGKPAVHDIVELRRK